MFKFTGLFAAQERDGRMKGHMSSVYFGHVFTQPFNPVAALELFCPLRRQAWALSTPVFGYRVAQNFGALEPREGSWHPRALGQLEGDLDRKFPKLDCIPDAIDCAARVSWWPPHATIIWQGHGFYQKLSFRPATDEPCDWEEIVYNDERIADDFRERYPEVFTPELVRVPEKVSPRPDTEKSPRIDVPPTHRKSTIPKNTGPSSTTGPDWDDANDSEVTDNDWYRDEPSTDWGTGYWDHSSSWRATVDSWKHEEHAGDEQPAESVTITAPDE